VTELPRHSETTDTEPAPTGGATGRRPSAGIVIAVFFGVLLIAMIVLHLAGVVGPGGH
jgi:hypothetical protein